MRIERLDPPSPVDILALRAQAGITQTQAAKLLHTSLRAYQQWEYGERPMHHAFWDCLRMKLALTLKTD